MAVDSRLRRPEQALEDGGDARPAIGLVLGIRANATDLGEIFLRQAQ